MTIPAAPLFLLLSLPLAPPPPTPVPGPPTPAPRARIQAEDAEEQYRYVAGLHDRGLHELVVGEARSFLERWPRHARTAFTRYRLGGSLFELGRLEEARAEYRLLTREREFEYAAEVWFRLGQCAFELGELAEARSALREAAARRADYLALPIAFLAAEVDFRAGDYPAAERGYAGVLGSRDREARAPLEAEARRGLVWCAWHQGQHERAVERIADFLERHPEDPGVGEVQLLLGECLLELDRPSDARRAYARVRSGPFADDARRGEGFAYVALEEHAEAARAFAALIEEHPQSEFVDEARLQMGIAHLHAGDARAAVRALQGGSPEGERALWLARAHAANDQGDQALAVLERALRSAEGAMAERLAVERGNQLYAAGRLDEAARAFEGSRSDYALYAAAVSSLNDGRTDEALRLTETLLRADPRGEYADEARLVRAEALFAAERYGEAATAYEEVLAGARGPERSRGLSRFGWCHYLAGSFPLAADAFARLAKDHPKAPEAEEARYMEGRSWESAAQPSRARRAWEGYLQTHPEGIHRPEVLLGLARTHEGLGGASHLERLLAQHPDHALVPDALYELAERHVEAGRSEDARSRYRTLVTEHPEHALAPAATYGLAFCEYEAGNGAESLRLLSSMRADGLEPELRLGALELLLHCAAETGDLERVRAAWRALDSLLEDDARRFEAGRIAASALAEGGRAQEAEGLLERLGRGLQESGLAGGVAIEKAWLALDRGDVRTAEAHVQAAASASAGSSADSSRRASADPQLCEAAFFVAEAWFEAGEDERAIALYGVAARKESPLGDRALYKQGFAELRSGRTAEAARSFERLVNEHGESPLYGEGLFLLGEARYRLDQLAPAVEAFQRLLREAARHESAPKARFRLGVALARLERWREAEGALAELAKRHPEFEHLLEAELWRGRALAANGKARSARSAFERVVAGDKGLLAARARLELGKLSQAAGDLEEALSEFLKVAVLYAPGEEVAEALYRAGRCLEEQGEREGASARYRELLQDHAKSQWVAPARERLQALGGS